MKAPESKWIELTDWLTAMEARLPCEWPPELPQESAPDFWFQAARLEMTTRQTLDAKVRQLVSGSELPAMTPLETWLYRRRVEWAVQLAIEKVKARVEPPVSLQELLLWALVTTWATDGCIAVWNHAERGGKPHPENPSSSLWQ